MAFSTAERQEVILAFGGRRRSDGLVYTYAIYSWKTA